MKLSFYQEALMLIFLAKWLVLLFFIFVYGYTIIKRWKVRRNELGKDEVKYSKLKLAAELVKLLIFPTIFPLSFFILGFMNDFSNYVPQFFIWSPGNYFWIPFAWLVGLAVLGNLILVVYYPSYFPKKQIDDIQKIPNEDRPLSAVISSLTVSLSAGIFEEIAYRFEMLTATQPLVAISSFVLGIDLIWVSGLIPNWLIFGFHFGITPILFVSAFIVSFLFSIAHPVDPITGKFSLKFWYRFIFAWFLSWILMSALLSFGLLGAMFVHFLADFIITIIVYITLYWKFEHVPAPENV